MKKIKLNTNKLLLAQEKISVLTHEEMFKMQGGDDGYSLATCWACVTYMCSSACTDETCGCIPATQNAICTTYTTQGVC